MSPLDIESLNPGIRVTVRRLRELGFDTIDSGDGKTHEFECDQDMPYVHIRVEPCDMLVEAHRLADAVKHIAGATVEASYSPADKVALLHLFGVSDEVQS